MTPSTLHRQYEASERSWSRIRDVLSGEDAVKRAGERYIAKLDGQDKDEYAAYVNRGFFYNATARTLNGYLGMVFRKSPAVKLPDSLNDFVSDVDLSGSTLEIYSRHVVSEVLSMGRGGTLIDWESAPDEDRAFISFYSAENILNWRQLRINGRMTLSLVVLREFVSVVSDDDPFKEETVEQIRVLKLVNDSIGWAYEVQLWQQTEKQDKKLEWVLIHSAMPTRRGERLRSIPFVFHGSKNSFPSVDRSPMEDIVVANLDHFRINVDFKHGLHFTALPTAWVSGFDSKTQLKIGSTVAWVTETPGATVGFLEFKGEGLMSFERALDRVERLLTVLGARLLESQKRAAESAEALSIRQAGESSIVGTLAHAVSDSMTDVLRWVVWWHGTEVQPSEIPHEMVDIELNTDFESNTLSAKDLVALVWAWQHGALSRETLHYRFEKGEVLPPHRTLEEELALIKASPPPPFPDSEDNPPLLETA